MLVINELPEVDVFGVPEQRNHRYYSKDWSLRWPLFRARIGLQEDVDELKVQLVDHESGELIAQAIFDGDSGVRLCSDSSLYYVLIARSSELIAVIGIGFLDHNQSFDFGISLQSFARRKAAQYRVESSWNSRLMATKEKQESIDQLAPALAPPPVSKNRWSRFDSDSDSEFEAPKKNSKTGDTVTESTASQMVEDDEEFGDFV